MLRNEINVFAGDWIHVQACENIRTFVDIFYEYITRARETVWIR